MAMTAKSFREYWLLAGDSETGGYQKYWIDLLGVLGVADATHHIDFQLPVATGTTTLYMDAWIPETKVLIEHKARGIKLDAPQSGHGGKTPYEQALEYDNARPYGDKARWIVTCNFDEIWIYDRSQPLAPPEKVRLADLPREIARLKFLVDQKTEKVRSREKEISIKAGVIVGAMYAELLKRYGDNPSAEALAALNRLCVRLVFVFYAEDAGLFPKDSFWTLIKSTPTQFLRQRLKELFKVLDTPKEKRDQFLEPELDVFPYTNGGLFSGAESDDIPPLDDEARNLLVESANFDWRDISPVIFGALFESTLNPVTRRAGGMVYTSVENIHKVIDPLFLNGLKMELEAIRKERSAAVRSAKAREFQAKLGALKFLDPACGSGNFLTETFISLRKLENEAIKLWARLKEGERLLNLDGEVKVTIDQFKGIEINDFAVAVAKTAMWISEAKMLGETAEILDAPPKYLPLHDYDGIIEGNALKIDWPAADYIMGNPPFVGASMMSAEQKAEAVAIFGKRKLTNSIDYVGAWYYKAIQIKSVKCAFVSTNSITQGEQVTPLWKPLFELGLEIDFAWRTFRWDSESTEKAHVHCVIVGFHCNDEDSRRDAKAQRKIIFDGDRTTSATHINGYLIDATDPWIESRAKPICDVPAMYLGNKPSDGGNLILTPEDRDEILTKEPQLARFIKPYVGATEYINGTKRYCLWLKDASPSDLHGSPILKSRIMAVKEMRLASTAKPTREKAITPHLFFFISQPSTNYILVPSTSSENREYVPIGFLEPSTIASNAATIIPSATLYHFGVLTSSLHMAWMRAVAGRLEMRYRYSANIVYNNFPWPEETSRTLRETIFQTAQAILDARALYPGSSLADLYDPLTMPPELRRAHAANDAAVLAAYGLAPDTPEPAIVAHLFNLYAAKTKGQ